MRKILLVILVTCAFASAAQTNAPLVQFGEKHTIHSKLLNEDREYWVYLPPSYKPTRNHARQKYPVLYMLDGDSSFDWACEVAQFLGDTLETPELMVVAIPNTDRNRDLTPTHAEGIATSGGGPVFERFLSEELAPEVDARFRTAPYRILFGHSLAGVLAVDSFLGRTNGFNAYIAVDPSLWWDNRLLVHRAEVFRPGTNSHDALFIAEANWPHNLDDATNSNKYSSDLFLAALKTNPAPGVRVGSRFFDQEDHPSSRLIGLYSGLRFIFEDYKPNNFWGLDTPELLEGHFKEISERLGLQLAPPEPYVNKIAGSFTNPTNAWKAIELYKLNATNYPTAADVYSRLGDAYRVKGDKDLAAQSYKKALEINPTLGSPKKELEKLKE